MTETKYRKLRLNELDPERRHQGFGRWPQTILFTDNDIIEGSNHFWASWVTSLPIPAHGPHTHSHDELLVMLGSDPDNPKDLGCEVELCMGPEMEKHLITESTLVYVPANLVHCPIRFRNLRKPFIFVQAQRAPKLTEKPVKELVSEPERDTMVFFDFDGTQTDEEVARQYQEVQKITNVLKKSPGDTASPTAEPASTPVRRNSRSTTSCVTACTSRITDGSRRRCGSMRSSINRPTCASAARVRASVHARTVFRFSSVRARPTGC